MGKVWIVFINKSPRGPLTIEEVNSLLSEKILKRTDLALKLNPELPDEKNHWKFLWQFEEFDQRVNKETIPEAKNNPPERAEDRRVSLSQNEITRQISKELPDEIAMINPEDLVLKSKKAKERGLGSLLEPELEKDIDTLPYESKNSNSLFPRVALVAAVLVALGGYLKQRGSSPVVSQEVNQIAKASSISVETLTPPSPPKLKPSQPVEVKRSVSQEKLQEEAPQLPKRNEISLEEYRKLKDERDEKDREEEQERERIKEAEKRLSKEEDDSREIAEDEGAAEESSLELPLKKLKKAKMKKRSKRRVQDEEESDRDSQQREDNQEENQEENQD
jgi:hypothetical protein